MNNYINYRNIKGNSSASKQSYHLNASYQNR